MITNVDVFVQGRDNTQVRVGGLLWQPWVSRQIRGAKADDKLWDIRGSLVAGDMTMALLHKHVDGACQCTWYASEQHRYGRSVFEAPNCRRGISADQCEEETQAAACRRASYLGRMTEVLLRLHRTVGLPRCQG